MSLINDALRKAQTNVDRGSMNPAPVATLAGAHVRPQKQSPVLRIIVGVLLVGLGGWAISLFPDSAGENETVASTPLPSVSNIEPAPAVEPVSVATPVVQAVVVEPEPVVQTAVPVVAEPIAAPEPVAVEPPIEVQAADVVVTQDVEQAVLLADTGVLAEAGHFTYVVRQGDTLGQIAMNNGVSLKQLKSYNGLTRDLIGIGQKLEIPSGQTYLTKGQAHSEAVAVAPVSEVEAPPPVAEVSLRDEIIYSLKQLDITAVMGEGSKARIMSSGQIHKGGELINLDLKIRFVGKKGKTLYFTDQLGEIYQKAL